MHRSSAAQYTRLWAPRWRPSHVVLGFVIAILLAEGAAQAQSISLPKIDNVNFFFQGGEIWNSGDLSDDESADGKDLRQYGWGFETTFDLTKFERWNVELAVGYDQMFLRTRLDDTYKLRGTVRNLPSISLYGSYPSEPIGFYAGFGTGIVSLSGVTAYDASDARQFTIGGDTFNLVGHIGAFYDFGKFSLFVEAAYQARYLGGVSYTSLVPNTPPPSGLPDSLYIGGPMLSFGAQIELSAKPKSASEDEVKAAALRQQREAARPTNKPLHALTVCTGTVSTDVTVVDDGWDPIRCGGSSSITANVWTVVPLDDVQIGEVIEVCAFAPTPKEFKELGKRWSPTRCGRPLVVEDNVKQLERLPPEPKAPAASPAK